MLAWIGFIRTLGLNADAVCAATYRFRNSCEINATRKHPMDRTRALLCFTSFLRKRNWRLRFDKSIVSRSKRVISPNPVITTFFTGEAKIRLALVRGMNSIQRRYRRVGRVKAGTHIVHIRYHQLRRAKYAYWGAWSTALGLISLRYESPGPLHSESGEGEQGSGVQS